MACCRSNSLILQRAVSSINSISWMVNWRGFKSITASEPMQRPLDVINGTPRYARTPYCCVNRLLAKAGWTNVSSMASTWWLSTTWVQKDSDRRHWREMANSFIEPKRDSPMDDLNRWQFWIIKLRVQTGASTK